MANETEQTAGAVTTSAPQEQATNLHGAKTNSTNPDDLIWGAGILLSIAAIPMAIAVNEYNFLDAQTYKQFIPSMWFVGISVSAIAVAESFHLARISSRSGQESEVFGLGLFIFNIFVMLGLVTMYVIHIRKSVSDQYLVEWSDLVVVAVGILTSIGIALILKHNLRG